MFWFDQQQGQIGKKERKRDHLRNVNGGFYPTTLLQHAPSAPAVVLKMMGLILQLSCI